jgi:D-sedoheptulose 7-phosphate isomerase
MSCIDTYLCETIGIARAIDHGQIREFAQGIATVRANQGRLFFIGEDCLRAATNSRKILDIESRTITDSELRSDPQILNKSTIGEKDAIVIFSISGGNKKTSPSLIHAINFAKKRKAAVLSIVSGDGGYAKKYGDACIVIPTISTRRALSHVEEWQAIIWRLVISMLDK